MQEFNIEKYGIMQRLPGYHACVMVNIRDPDRPENLHQFCALYQGLKEGCMPIIGVDGSHLRGAYTGHVLVAVGKDGNNIIFPIAYAVVEA